MSSSFFKRDGPRCRPWHAASLGLAFALGGCAVTDVDHQLSTGRDIASQQFDADLKWLTTDDARRKAEDDVDQRLAAPLGREDAVRIALAYSPAMQLLLSQRIGDAADAAQSARLPNPVFEFEHLLRAGAGMRELEIKRTLNFSLLDLVLLPARRRTSARLQTMARLRAAADVVRVATETRQAWIDAVASAQVARYAEQVKGSAEASAELARRMQANGNFSRLQRAREQVFLADALTQAARSQLAETRSREALVRMLGLDSRRAARLTLPDRLPDVPIAIAPESAVAQSAIDQRLDVQLARADLDAASRLQGQTALTGFVDGFQLGLERTSVSGAAPQRGYVLSLPLPIFNAGDERGEAAYIAARNRTAQVAIDAASQVREAYASYRTAHDLARRYRDQILPLRKTIADENLLRYNGMLISVFELLADARVQIESVALAIDAEREFWRADAVLQANLIGGANRAVADR